ncbi:MAG: restriction endonuclease subunit S [Ignavibacteriales bacterium]|nr:restriction endonuclease subunit S [Ignavibacteriales bacterium]
MRNTKTISVLRFPGFTEKWKRFKLNEILFEHRIRNSKNEFEEVFSVAKEKGVINQIEHLGRSYASENISNYKVVFPGDVVYTKSPTAGFPFGIIKQNKMQRTGVVSVLYAVYKPITPLMGLLIDYYFSSYVNTYNYLVPLVHKGAKNTLNIGNTEFLNGAKIFLPINKNEQKKITDFFLSIDNRVHYLSEKKKNLEQFKKGIIQKLFSQNLRFKNEDGLNYPEWKKYSVKKIMDRYSKPVEVDLSESYLQIGIKSHGKGIFYKEGVSGLNLGNKRIFWIEEGKLIFNIVFAWEGAVAKTTIFEKGMVASHRFPMYQPKSEMLDLDFILLFFLTQKGIKYLELASPGGAGRNKTLGQSEFEKLKITLPSLKEQKKIASFLNSIGNQIQLVSEQLEETKLYRKGLLNKMLSD